MGTGITILLVFIAVVVTLLIAVPVTRKIAVDNKIKQDAEKIGTAEEKARNIIDEALKTAETKKREALLEAKEEPTWAFAIKERFEESIEEAVHSDAFPMKPQRIVAEGTAVIGAVYHTAFAAGNAFAVRQRRAVRAVGAARFYIFSQQLFEPHA